MKHIDALLYPTLCNFQVKIARGLFYDTKYLTQFSIMDFPDINSTWSTKEAAVWLSLLTNRAVNNLKILI